MTEEIQAEVEVEVEEAVVEDPNAGLTPDEIYRKTNGFTPQEAAKELGGADDGWTGKRLRRYIRSGDCPAKKVRGRWYVLIGELETLLETLEAKKAAKAAKAAAEAAAKAAAEAEAAASEVEVEAPVVAELG